MCLASARKILHRLAERAGASLPPPRSVPVPSAVSIVPAEAVPDTKLSCTLADIGPVSLELPGGTADRRLWEAMMNRHHPLGNARPPGGQLRYWIRSERDGVLGGISFGSAAWKLRARDNWIGWSADARAANIERVICNHRFLLLPGVRVHGLASRALRVAAQRVAGDWHARYSAQPVAVYTHIAAEYSGYSYHRAGWICAGQTAGRRGDVGKVWVLPLGDGWREILCREERHPIGTLAGLYDGLPDMDWAEREYGRSRHTDGRVRDRIIRMGRTWIKATGQDLPVIFPGSAEQKAAFRLLSNPEVRMEHILEPHFEATADRCRRESVILAVQGTTVLNGGGPRNTDAPDAPSGGDGENADILVHVGLAVTPEGRPLGMFTMDATFRKDRGLAKITDKESQHRVEGLDRARQLAEACSDTRVISVCDCEGDFRELLASALSRQDALLLRPSRSAWQRVRMPSGNEECLWDHMATHRPTALLDFAIPDAGGPCVHSERIARLEIRTTGIRLLPPREKSGQKPLPLFAVSATEVEHEASDDPVHWLLLTTEWPSEGEAEAVRATTLLDWYRKHWSIESWFRTLRTVTRIKSRRLVAADDLRKCLAFDAVTACRVADQT